jgi:hypothetical protein
MDSEEMANKIKNLLDKLIKPKYKDINDIVVSFYDLKKGPLVYVTVVAKNKDEFENWNNIQHSTKNVLKFMGINKVELFPYFEK